MYSAPVLPQTFLGCEGFGTLVAAKHSLSTVCCVHVHLQCLSVLKLVVTEGAAEELRDRRAAGHRLLVHDHEASLDINLSPGGLSMKGMVVSFQGRAAAERSVTDLANVPSR